MTENPIAHTTTRDTTRSSLSEPISAQQRALLRWFTPLVRDTGGDWREQALCAQSDPEMWFPEGDHRITQGRQAKAICAKCPVQTQCLEEALANNDMFGVWGGLTASERHRIRKPAVQRTHCVNGHEYTDENTRITSVGTRRCRKCDTVHTRRWRRGGKL